MKITFDVALFLVIGTIPYLLAWSRLNRTQAREALYQGARYNVGIRS